MCAEKDVPEAVLIRALIEADGPAKATKYLNIVTVTIDERIEGANNKTLKKPAPGIFLKIYNEKISASEIPTIVIQKNARNEFSKAVPKTLPYLNSFIIVSKFFKPFQTYEPLFVIESTSYL